MSDIGQVQSSFQFIQSRLVKLNLNNYRLRIDTDILKKNLQVDFKIESIQEQDGYLIGVISIHIAFKIKDDQGKALDGKLVMEAGFADKVETGIDLFTKMLKLNGVSSLYSLCRAHIISVTSLSFDGSPLRLPMINVVKLNEIKDNQPE